MADDSSVPGAGTNNNGGIAIRLEGNVGSATADNSNSPGSFGAALTAPVAPNASYANLASAVTTTTGSGGSDLVGSTATVLAGTNDSGSPLTITMQWRTPTAAEQASMAVANSGAAVGAPGTPGPSALPSLTPGIVADGGLIVAADQGYMVPAAPAAGGMLAASSETASASSSDPAISSLSALDAPAGTSAAASAVLPMAVAAVPVGASQQTVNPVPEPDTLLLLLAAGGGGLLWQVRRRKRNSQRKRIARK